MSILIIVESPSKAKTISKFLDKDIYILKSSFGHIRDLCKKEISIDINNNFKPKYDILSDKKTIVNELISISKKVKEVIIASDEDREGEAIAMHLLKVLNLSPDTTKRIVFHEITKNAILNALDNPKTVNKSLFLSQQTRRLLDRIVGFQLSPVLWKYIKYADKTLSAGRVQSAVVKLLYNKEKEITSFISSKYSSITCCFIVNKKEKINNIGLSIIKDNVETDVKFTKENALKFIEDSLDSYLIKNIDTETSKINSPPPYTTSSLQQDAFNKLSFSIKKTMDVAQKLYESGKITYMRTDSTLLSNLILGNIKTFIEINYGENYYRFMQYQTKSKNAQEAHEAIRPTNISLLEITSEKHDVIDQNKLYKLIWQRTIASQMKPALYRILKISLSNDEPYYFNGNISRCYFEGFKILYNETVDDDNEFKILLEKLNSLKKLKVSKMISEEVWTAPPNRYNESSLVKKLESSGIGRPSTYANIISTIIDREYVERKNIDGVEHEITSYIWKPSGDIIENVKKMIFGGEKNRLVISEIGTIVTEYLEKNFPLIMDLDFTVNMENDLDLIAEGSITWLSVMNKFYDPFNKKITSLMNVKEQDLEITDVERFEKNLGKHPNSGLDIVVKKGKFGPMIELGKLKEEGHGYFNLKSFLMNNKKKMEDITLKDALEIMKFPKLLGKIDKHDVSIMMGKYGFYIKYDKLNCGIPKNYDIETLTFEDAKDIIENNKKEEKEEKNGKKFSNSNSNSNSKKFYKKKN